jgi:hypothetical protein
MENQETNKESNSLKDYFSLGEVFTYFFRKKDPNRKPDINLRMMHGVNKFSIIVFLLGMTYFIIKKVFFQ